MDFQSALSTYFNHFIETIGNIYDSFSFKSSPKIPPVEIKAQPVLVNNMAFQQLGRTSKIIINIAGLSGATAVALGAYGAHVFHHTETEDELKQVFDVGNRYHLLHSVVLMAVPISRKPQLSGILFCLGILLFSGSCYFHALTGCRDIRKVTPYGGVLLLAGWLSLIF